MTETLAKITKETLIGDVMREHSQCGPIIEKYFGEGCFTCPGMWMENIAFGAAMHSVDADAIVKEINERIRISAG